MDCSTEPSFVAGREERNLLDSLPAAVVASAGESDTALEPIPVFGGNRGERGCCACLRTNIAPQERHPLLWFANTSSNSVVHFYQLTAIHSVGRIPHVHGLSLVC